MTARRYDALAADLRSRVGDGLPVPVGRLARALGITVRPVSLPQRISGVLFRYPDGHCVIAYNRWMKPERIRFTIAHELGHWALHRHATPGECDAGISGPHEREANAFAAALLMPSSAVAYWWQREEFTSLCARFGVSYEAMHWRLVELGLI